MIRRRAILSALFCLSAACGAGQVQAADASAPVCHSAPDSAETVAARAAVQADATLLTARFTLADALARQGCFEDAVKTLEEGQASHPKDAELQNRLRYARSQISEQRYFDGLAQAQEDAKYKRALLRCQRLNDVAACDESVAAQPDNIEALSAKADALLVLHRPAEAIPVLRHAVNVDKTNDAVRGKLASAEAQRGQLLARCEAESGEPGLAACQSALLRGAQDEFNVQRRRGTLLQASNRTSAALDAYIAAGTLRPDDRSVALAIVALTDSTGRADPVAVQARVNARATIARVDPNNSALREARAVNPGLPPFATRQPAPRRQQQPEAVELKKTYSNAAADGRAH